MIPDRHLAEDAFQAVFIVLARKADVVQPAEALAQWLYGVSYRVAMRARAMAARRAKRERVMASLPDFGRVEREPDDLSPILDEAISQLPGHLREAVVLCELNGISRKEASQKLGIAEGTLSSRLAAARKKLASILNGRGAALPAGALATSAIVSPTLLQATVLSVTNQETVSATVQTLIHAGAGMLFTQ